VITVIAGKEVYTAWAGDAEAAMVRRGGEVTKLVTTLHKASNEVRTLRQRKEGQGATVCARMCV
jgi:serine/threonine protein phosphatase PrpC